MFKLKRWQFWLFHFLLSMVMGIMSAIPNSSSSDNSIFAILLLIFVILDLLVIAGRIKDYGHNPWLSLLVFIPLVNIVILLFYGFAKHKKDASDADNNESTKNKTNEQPSKYNEHENSSNTNTQDIDENEFYKIVNQEIKEDKKDEALWLKALQEADGDKDKTLARYIGYRVQELKEEKRLNEQMKQERERQLIIQEENKALKAFLLDQKAHVIDKISENKIRIGYSSSPMDAIIVYDGTAWKVESFL